MDNRYPSIDALSPCVRLFIALLLEEAGVVDTTEKATVFRAKHTTAACAPDLASMKAGLARCG